MNPLQSPPAAARPAGKSPGARLSEELTLLVKSRYPVIYLETPDEEHALGALGEIAAGLGLIQYDWSVARGLRRKGGSPFYNSGDPSVMIRTIFDLLGSERYQPGLYILCDFQRQLEKEYVRRIFKELLLRIENLPDTVVVVAPEYRFPEEFIPYTAHITGGYPDKEETAVFVRRTLNGLAGPDGALRVELDPGSFETLCRSLAGLTRQQIRNFLTRAVLEDGVLDSADLAAVEEFKRKAFDSQGLLSYCPEEERADLAGFPNLRRWLAERESSFGPANEEPALPRPKGVLIMGVQGCGKSLAVKFVAHELGLPLYRLDPGRLYGSYIGQTEGNLRKALDLAEKLSPLCLWIDELEKGFAASDGQADGGVSQRVLGTFLTWMQERKAPCFLAATANDVYRLPPEFLRKGRFDEIFFVDLPGAAVREEIFRIQLAKRGLEPRGFDLPALAASARDFSGAEIEQAVISALYSARHKHEALATAHIREQLESAKPLAVLKAEEIAALRAWAGERTVPA